MLATPVVAMLLAATFVWAGDPPTPAAPQGCSCSGVVLHRSIPAQKLPSEVEGQNKIHVRLNPVKDPKTGALVTMEVLGKAIYPDGVTLYVRARHRKSAESFTSTRAVVRQGLFMATLGPLTKAIPGGGLVVEVWFVAAQQTKEIQARLIGEHWYHSTPPCIHDTCNYYWLPYSMGGCDAEDQAEKDEKAAIESARNDLASARSVAEAAFRATIAKEKTVPDAARALAKLTGDLEAVRSVFNAWVATRQFLLFPRPASKLKLLSGLISDEARANAVLAGVAVEGISADKAPSIAQSAGPEATRINDELKGFVAEAGSLDKQWDEAHAVPGKVATPPADGSAKSPPK
jgi:hypothetical protein